MDIHKLHVLNMVVRMLLVDFINVGYGDAVLVRDMGAPFTMLIGESCTAAD